jgi:hypothetical protein
LGSPLPPGPRHFGRVQRYRPSAIGRELSHAASSSLELSASSRVLRPTTCPRYPGQSCDHPEASRAPPLGFQFPHRGVSRRRPLLPGVPSPRADGPSSTFRTSSTVCSATCLAGLFRPAATSRVCPSGVCPSPRSRTGFRRPSHALLPFDGGACGLTRASDPIFDFRALLPAESAVSTEPVRAPADPRPSWASPPPGLPSPHRGNAFTFPPPTTFTATSPLQPVLGVSPVRGSVCLGPGYRPARGFWPEPPPSFRETGSRPRVLRPTGPPDTQHLGARLVPRCSLRNALIFLMYDVHALSSSCTHFCGSSVITKSCACGRVVDTRTAPAVIQLVNCTVSAHFVQSRDTRGISGLT